MKLKILLLGLAVSLASQAELPWWSVGPQQLSTYSSRCVQSLSREAKTADIFKSLAERQKLSSAKTYPLVILDGLRLKNISASDLGVLMELTQDSDATTKLWEDEYPVVEKMDRSGVLRITRKCLSKTCKERGLSVLNLAQFNSGPDCSEALCAAQKVFGPSKGIEILWTQLRYGLNLSPYQNINGDPEGFSMTTLLAIEGALGGIPYHLLKVVSDRSGFFRFKKGYTLKMYGDSGNTIANAMGAVFDSIDRYNLPEQIGIFSHEMGHRVSWLSEDGLDASVAWLKASGWQNKKADAVFSDVNNGKQGQVSKYGKTNNAEDFAESFIAYRFAPDYLQKASPARYAFMKQNVFRGVEYNRDLCWGDANID